MQGPRCSHCRRSTFSKPGADHDGTTRGMIFSVFRRALHLHPKQGAPSNIYVYAFPALSLQSQCSYTSDRIVYPKRRLYVVLLTKSSITILYWRVTLAKSVSIVKECTGCVVLLGTLPVGTFIPHVLYDYCFSCYPRGAWISEQGLRTSGQDIQAFSAYNIG